MKPAKIEVYIEELVLHGFTANDRYRIGDALQVELTRMFSEQGMPPGFARNIETDRVDAGSFHVVTGAQPQTIGAHLAQSLYGRLRK
jgi:hypothetical protein